MGFTLLASQLVLRPVPVAQLTDSSSEARSRICALIACLQSGCCKKSLRGRL